MVAVLDSMMFAAAFAAAVWVFAFTLVPSLPRIAAVLRGEAVYETYVARSSVRDRRVRAQARPVRQERAAGLREAA